MSLEETATSESTEASPLDEQQQREQLPEGTDWRAETTRLQQELKRARDLNRQAKPFVETALALQAAPGGTAIIEKLQKGEALTAVQEKKLEKAQEETGTTGVTQEQLKELLETQAQGFEQRLFERDKAKTALDDLNIWATEKFPGFEELHKTPEWKGKINSILRDIQEEVLVVPEGEDSYKYAYEQAYGWVQGLNPDIGKEKPSKKTEKQRREAISSSTVQAGGVAPEESDDIPDYAKLDRAPLGVAGGGKSFGSLRRTK